MPVFILVLVTFQVNKETICKRFMIYVYGFNYFIYILVEEDILKVSLNEETKLIDATALSKFRKRIIFILLVNHTEAFQFVQKMPFLLIVLHIFIYF